MFQTRDDMHDSNILIHVYEFMGRGQPYNVILDIPTDERILFYNQLQKDKEAAERQASMQGKS